MKCSYYNINGDGVQLAAIYNLLFPTGIYEGTAMKYIVRAGRKGGESMECVDLNKALDYLRYAAETETRGERRNINVASVRAAKSLIMESDILQDWKKDALINIITNQYHTAAYLVSRRLKSINSVDSGV